MNFSPDQVAWAKWQELMERCVAMNPLAAIATYRRRLLLFAFWNAQRAYRVAYNDNHRRCV